jgi:threonyl-tRNA synthetase
MLVVGERESAEGSVSARLRDGRQMPPMKIRDFADYAAEKVSSQALTL